MPTYSEGREASEGMNIIIVIFFCIICFLILLKLFIAIIMSNYIFLRRVGELRTEAKSRIGTYQGLAWVKKLLNFITCKAPFEQKTNKKDIEEHKENDVLAMKPKEIDHNKLSTWNICLINWNILWSSEQDENASAKHRQKEVMELIVKEDYEQRMEEKRLNERNIIHKITNGIIYLIFLALFITLMMLQIDVYRLRSANKAMKLVLPQEYPDNTLFPAEDLPKKLEKIFEEIGNLRHKVGESVKLGEKKYIYSQPFVVLTYRRNKYVTRSVEKTTEALKTKFILDEKHKSTEDTSDLPVGDEVYKYLPPGHKRTFGRAGGISVNLKFQEEGHDTGNTDEVIEHLLKDTKILRLIALEVFAYIPNSEMFTWSSIVFKLQPAGSVRLDLQNISFHVDQYSTKAKKARILLEVIICLFVLYFTIKELILFGKTYAKVCAEDRAKYPKPGPEDGLMSRILLFMYINSDTTDNNSACDWILLFVLGILKLLFYFIKHLIITIFTYLFMGFFHFLNVAAIVFYYFLIVNW